MRVILVHDVKGIGRAEELKDVADGYARNFLFPHNLAVPASQKAIVSLQAKHTKIKKEAQADLQREQALAGRLDGYELELREKANGQGVFYAAVTASKVAQALSKAGYAVEASQVSMKPIKQPGTYRIKVIFTHGLEASITLILGVV